MPYIVQSDRSRSETQPTNPGELNYAITLKMIKYTLGNKRYSTMAEIVGDVERIRFTFFMKMAYDKLPDASSYFLFKHKPMADEILEVVGYYVDNIHDKRNLHTVTDALDMAAREYYRRVVAPYEDRKRDEQGEVYPECLVDQNA